MEGGGRACAGAAQASVFPHPWKRRRAGECATDRFPHPPAPLPSPQVAFEWGTESTVVFKAAAYLDAYLAGQVVDDLSQFQVRDWGEVAASARKKIAVFFFRSPAGCHQTVGGQARRKTGANAGPPDMAPGRPPAPRRPHQTPPKACMTGPQANSDKCGWGGWGGRGLGGAVTFEKKKRAVFFFFFFPRAEPPAAPTHPNGSK